MLGGTIEWVCDLQLDLLCVLFVGFEAPGTQALCRAWAGSDEHRYVGAEALQLLTRRHHQGVE